MCRSCYDPETRVRHLRKQAHGLKRLESELEDLKAEVQRDIERLHVQRGASLRPDPMLLPSGWTPVFCARPRCFFKIAAVSKEREVVSVYDGKTPYQLGRFTFASRGAASWPPLLCCIFVFTTEEEALEASFPGTSEELGAPRVLCRVRASGVGYQKEGTGKFAFAAVETVELSAPFGWRPSAVSPSAGRSGLLGGAGGGPPAAATAGIAGRGGGGGGRGWTPGGEAAPPRKHQASSLRR